MQESVPLEEHRRAKRRTVADALEVVHEKLGVYETTRAEIKIHHLQLPSGECTALVAVLFPDLGCHVSLPTSARFRGFSERSSQNQLFEISRLDRAKVDSDGSVRLVDGTSLRAVEVIPSHLPYELSKLEKLILWYVILLTRSLYCFRSIHEDLPEQLQQQVSGFHLDWSRVRTIRVPALKVIKGFIEDHHRQHDVLGLADPAGQAHQARNRHLESHADAPGDRNPQLKVSSQKIADTLAKCGVRVAIRRPRTVSQRSATRATI
jgi:hypothetical protein